MTPPTELDDPPVPDPAPDPVPDPFAVVDVDDDAAYRRRLGARLRATRRAHGMRLQDVEDRSEGRFKAVVVGSYERGDRAIAAHKLASLASFYGVEVADLLPDEPAATGPRIGRRGLSLDVEALRRRARENELAPLHRYVQHVQWLRDTDDEVVRLRLDDLQTIAATLGLGPQDLEAWLDERGIVHH